MRLWMPDPVADTLHGVGCTCWPAPEIEVLDPIPAGDALVATLVVAHRPECPYHTKEPV